MLTISYLLSDIVMEEAQYVKRCLDVIDRLEAQIASVRSDYCLFKRALVDYNRHRGHLDVGVKEVISMMADRSVDIISKVVSKGDRMGKLLGHLERHYGKFERAIRLEAGKKPSVARFLRISKTISDAVTQSVRDHDQMVSLSTCLFEGYSLLCENPREISKGHAQSNDLCFTKSERRKMLAAYKRIEQSSFLSCGENFSFYKRVLNAFRFPFERNDVKCKKSGEIFFSNGKQLVYDNSVFDDLKRIAQYDYKQRLCWEKFKDSLVDELLDRDYVYNLLLVTLGENTDVAFRDDHLLQERSDEKQKQIPFYYYRKTILSEYDAVVAIGMSMRTNEKGVNRKNKKEKLLQRTDDRLRIEEMLYAVGLSIEALRAYDNRQVNEVERQSVAKGVVRVNLDNMSLRWTDACRGNVPIVTKSETYFLVVIMAFLRFGEGQSPSEWVRVIEVVKGLKVANESRFLWCQGKRLVCADPGQLFRRVRSRFEAPMRKRFGDGLRLLPCDKRGKSRSPGVMNWWEYVDVIWESEQKTLTDFPFGVLPPSVSNLISSTVMKTVMKVSL